MEDERVVSDVATEVEAMAAVGKALEPLDEATKKRVVDWVLSRFGIAPGTVRTVHNFGPPARGNHITQQQAAATPPAAGSHVVENEIPGIARLNDDGSIKLTVRDLKAKSTNDAAIRIAHLVLYATEALKGEKSVSSAHAIVPELKEWRAYNGNTRTALGNHKGLIRDGDNITLDAHSRQDAERYVNEILDENVSGSWTPTSRPKKQAKTKVTAK